MAVWDLLRFVVYLDLLTLKLNLSRYFKEIKIQFDLLILFSINVIQIVS